MKISLHSKEARDLIRHCDNIDRFERSHIVENYRNEMNAGYEFAKSIFFLVVITAVIGAIMFIAIKLGVA